MRPDQCAECAQAHIYNVQSEEQETEWRGKRNGAKGQAHIGFGDVLTATRQSVNGLVCRASPGQGVFKLTHEVLVSQGFRSKFSQRPFRSPSLTCL